MLLYICVQNYSSLSYDVCFYLHSKNDLKCMQFLPQKLFSIMSGCIQKSWIKIIQKTYKIVGNLIKKFRSDL